MAYNNSFDNYHCQLDSFNGLMNELITMTAPIIIQFNNSFKLIVNDKINEISIFIIIIFQNLNWWLFI